jgi:hypothetical protein
MGIFHEDGKDDSGEVGTSYGEELPVEIMGDFRPG